MARSLKIVWVSSGDSPGRVTQYSRALLPALDPVLRSRGASMDWVPLEDFPHWSECLEELASYRADVLVFQHDYASFGGYSPRRYWFPRLIRGLREIKGRPAGQKMVATAHEVLMSDFKLPTPWRHAWWRALGNQWHNSYGRTRCEDQWGRATWGALDGVIVHSRHQENSVKEAGAPSVRVIPHFVFPTGDYREKSFRSPPVELSKIPSGAAVVLAFGFFSPEKGQDLIIRAWHRLKGRSAKRLVLAGGVRRQEDQDFFDECMHLARSLGVADDLLIPGYVDPEHVDLFYERADLVVAPFRSTTGSSTLAQAIGRGAAVLASDLTLHREVAERVPGCLETFRNDSEEDLARKIEILLRELPRREALMKAARTYRDQFSVESTAQSYADYLLDLPSKT